MTRNVEKIEGADGLQIKEQFEQGQGEGANCSPKFKKMTPSLSMEDYAKAIQQKKEQLRSSLDPSPKRSDLREELNAQMNEL